MIKEKLHNEELHGDSERYGSRWRFLRNCYEANRIVRMNVLQASKEFRRLHVNEFSEHETNCMCRKRRELNEWKDLLQLEAVTQILRTWPLWFCHASFVWMFGYCRYKVTLTHVLLLHILQEHVMRVFPFTFVNKAPPRNMGHMKFIDLSFLREWILMSWNFMMWWRVIW
jgi:hypothetical protein